MIEFPSSRDDRGVSEMLGYVLLFSVVLLSIVSVSVVGTNVLHQGRDTVTTGNVQAAFERMAETLTDVSRTRIQRRSVSLSTGSGQISVGDPVEISINHSVSSPAPDHRIAHVRVEPIVFSVGDSRLVYEGGAVFRERNGASAVIRSPPFRLGDEKAIVPAVSLNATGSSSVSGSTTLRFVQRNGTVADGLTETAPFDTWTPAVGGTLSHNLEISVATNSPERARAWKRALLDMRSDWVYCSVSGSTTTCGYQIDYGDRVLVHNVSIDYGLST